MFFVAGIMAFVSFLLSVLSFLLYRYMYINIKSLRSLVGLNMTNAWLFVMANKLRLKGRDEYIVYAFKYTYPLSGLYMLATIIIFMLAFKK